MSTTRLLTLFSVFLFSFGTAFAQTSTIAVAANMKDAFIEIAAAYKATGKSELRVVYGSSGNFATQIMNGAPFNLFIAADEQFPLELFSNGRTTDEGVVYAIGKLAILTKTSSGIRLLDSKTDIAKAISKANKIAIAKPELAPYGRAAVQYLKAEGLSDLAKDKLVYADNIGAATTYVMSGAADIGFTALSLAKSPEVTKQTSFLLVDTKLYEPIKQRMVLIKGAPQESVDLYRFMQGHQAKSILQRYGYTTP
ncbi:molybdate ABC transporter substrate-binding protein [Polynucleobacter sp. JS-JIR-II-50]|uniref:molybdate ABC transporter substrate-binding protein n=1 Tax=Polynucleobacter sp. JS-JIR-II-50 TaxID=2576919 RepID=UPI001BFD567C|nr:molybdate ABC transporter substrate-binding protein [Polynucleobacter sp. JS-JIR-II-50]QWE05115.1 molybdate ABC transporter substrate-binding protein [Polynucleobacter sp. JS-JIR-II-50]